MQQNGGGGGVRPRFSHDVFNWVVQIYACENRLLLLLLGTGISVSEVLILESVNPQYDDRLFIEL